MSMLNYTEIVENAALCSGQSCILVCMPNLKFKSRKLSRAELPACRKITRKKHLLVTHNIYISPAQCPDVMHYAQKVLLSLISNIFTLNPIDHKF